MRPEERAAGLSVKDSPLLFMQKGQGMKRDIKQLKMINAKVAEIIGEPETTTAAAVGRLSDRDLERVAGGDYEPLFKDFPNLGKITSGNGAKGTPEKPVKEKRKRATPAEHREKIERIKAEIIANGGGELETVGDLPETMTALIDSVIYQFCERDKIEDMKKERQTVFQALCMDIGKAVKQSQYIIDQERSKRNGGKVYDVRRVAALADCYLSLCARYTKAPFIVDFARFAGVSESWLLLNGDGDRNGQGLTPERVQLVQKLRQAQELGLASMIADGRQNPTGALAILNHWHGWTQSREIIHTTAQETRTAASYPQLQISTDTNGDI